MGEHNQPEEYGRVFRPYLDAPTDVEFEGVAALEGPVLPRRIRRVIERLSRTRCGPWGRPRRNPLVDHLDALRADTPPEHRAFIEAAAVGPDLQEYAATPDDEPRAAFNEGIDLMVGFRERQIDVVAKYLADELGESEGTGGLPYGRFLAMFVDKTRVCKLTV